MLSVVIETSNDDDALARTLASLVHAALEGMVREVIVCDRGAGERTHRVADDAGCHFVAQATAAAGISQARGDWVLLLEPGARLGEGWMEAVALHTARSTLPARFSPSRHDTRFLSRMLLPRRSLRRGLLITRHQALSLAEENASAAGLAKAVPARSLPAEILANGSSRASG